MSDEMPSWKSLASAASRSIKSYVSQRDLKRPFPASREASVEGTSKRQTWGQWAGQKLRQVQGESKGLEQILLFPGWATRRFPGPSPDHEAGAPFDVELFVSGFASRSSGPGFGTRSGRAFLKLAKSFAALPKLTPQEGTAGGENASWMMDSALSKSTEDLLMSTRLPPPPDQMDDRAEVEALESRLRELDVDSESTPSGPDIESESVASSEMSRSSSVYFDASVATSSLGAGSSGRGTMSLDLQRWHANLEARLHPFWSSALSARTVRVSLFAADPSLYESGDDPTMADDDARRPLMHCDVVTTTDGSFQARFHVPWQDLCVHPQGIQIAFGDRQVEYELFVAAELFPPPPPRTPNPAVYQPHMPYVARPTASSSISIPLTYAPVRVISDIDDTVKLSSVLSGARAVFQNVFVKDLGDNIIPGMAEWYTVMWKRGVRFHYVSNGPYELLPVLNEFFQLTRLPPGSVKLRSYGGRSLFSGLLSAPAARKRAGVVSILDSFSDAQFILIGDSGEQDLELYASTAKERPNQVLAIFIRDVSADTGAQPLDDPTGSRVLRMDTQSQPGSRLSSPTLSRRSSTRSSTARGPIARSMSEMKGPLKYATRRPARMHSETDLTSKSSETSEGYFTSAPLTASPVTEEPEEMSTHSSPGVTTEQENYDAFSGSRQYISEAERRRNDLQMRVWRARLEIPERVPLRIFRNPNECLEATIILDGLMPGEQNNLS